MSKNPTTPWLTRIVWTETNEPVSEAADAIKAASYLSPMPEDTEAVDPEYGFWNVWTPDYMTKTAHEDGLFIMVRGGEFTLFIDIDPV